MTAAKRALGIVELALGEGARDRAAEVLRALFAERLSAWLGPRGQQRPAGADKVLVVLPEVADDAALEARLEPLFAALEGPIALAGRRGAAIHAGFTFHDAGGDLRGAVREAGQALARAKALQLGWLLYGREPELAADAPGRFQDLEEALSLGEFQLHFQARLHPVYRSLAGAEAFLRWHTRHRKVLTPEQFLPAETHHPVVEALYAWALKAAVARLARWRQRLHLQLALPARLLARPGLALALADACALHGVEPGRILLAFPQDALLSGPGAAEAAASGAGLVAVNRGESLASALAGIRALPEQGGILREFKLAPPEPAILVRDLAYRQMLRRLVEEAHRRRLKVAFAGADHEKIAEVAREIGCDLVQGRFYDIVLPLQEFEARHQLRP